MFKVVATQIILITVLSLAAYEIYGISSAFSLVLGGFSYILPTYLAALLLKISQPYPNLAGIVFIGSTSLKTILSALLLVLCFILYPPVRSVQNFLAFFIGLLTVSHLVFLIFLKVSHYGR